MEKEENGREKVRGEREKEVKREENRGERDFNAPQVTRPKAVI